MPHGKTSPAAQTTFALGLSTPSADSQAADEPEVKRIEQPSAQVRSGRGLWWLMTAVGLTAASFYVAEKEGFVRQYWPEFYQFLRNVQQIV